MYLGAVSNATNNFSIYSNGGQSFFVGNVGIGYSGAAAPLAVNGNVGIGFTSPLSNLVVSGNATIGSGYNSYSAPSNGLLVQGNVGIGRTTPISQLDVAGSVASGTTGSIATNLTSPNNVYIQGRYAYVADSGGKALSIFDVSDPAVPAAKSTISTINAANGFSVSVQGRYAYVTEGGFLDVFDVTNPASPTAVNSVALAQTSSVAGNLYVQGGYAYVTSYSGTGTPANFEIFDISNPSSPFRVGNLTSTLNQPGSVYVQGNYAYVINGTGGTLKIINVSNPTSPSVSGTISSLTSPNSVFVQGRYAYVTQGGSPTNFYIIDVSTPTSPVKLTTILMSEAVYNSYVQGRYAYVVGATKLYTIDVSNAGTPFIVGSVADVQPGLFVQGRYAYNAGGSGGSQALKIFELGGAYIQQLEAGGIETGTLATRENLQVGNDLEVQGGAQIGKSLDVTGPLSVFGGAANSTFTVDRSGNVGIGTTSVGGSLIVGTGNVGIGFTSPSAPLEVFSTVNGGAILARGSTDNIQLIINNTGTGGKLYSIGSTGGTSSLGQGALSFRDDTAGATRMLIDKNGNVGIGTSVGTTLLTVGSPAATGNLTVFGTSTTCTIGNGTGATNCSSDARLKTDINSLAASTLEDIMRLNPVSFKWIDPNKDQSTNLGFLAQEVQQIFPAVVHELPDGYLGMDYAALIVPTIKAVQAEQGEIVSLQNKLNNLTIDSNGNVGIGNSNPQAKLTVSGDTALSGNLSVSLSETSTQFIIKNSLGQGLFSVDSTGNAKLAGTLTTGAGAFDVSEDYHVSPNEAGAGDVVVIASQAKQSSEIASSSATPRDDGSSVMKSTTPYDNTVIGVVSTKPGIRLSQDNSTDSQPVAISGRVPVKVSTINGNISKGDFLTSSSIPGVAMKATKPGQVIGKALEDFVCHPDPIQGVTQSCHGKILVFVNISYADPGNFLASLSLDTDGNLITPKVKVDKLLISDELGVSSSELNNSLLAYEFGTTQNPQTNNGTSSGPAQVNVLASLKNLDQALVDVKSKEATDSANIAELGNRQQALGDSIASQSAEIANTKSETKSLASQLADLAAKMATSSASSSNCSLSPEACNLNLTPPDILLATGSATLANLKVTSEATVSGMLAAYDLNVSNSFKSLGLTTLAKTNVAGDLTVDGTLAIENGSEINVLGTLYLQKSYLAEGLNIFNGKITIDKDGNITTQGKIVATEVKTQKLTISNPVATSSATLAASIGTATMPANLSKVTISTTEASESAKVFITPTTPTDKVLSVTNIKNKQSFDVSTLTPTLTDINFNWWIVQTE